MGVNANAAPNGDVPHIEGHDQGQIDFRELGNQVKIAPQVAGIDDHQNAIDGRRVLLLAQEYVNGEHLVGRVRREAVRAGQVNQLKCFPARECHRAHFVLDRDARIVPGVLGQSGQGVKERGLAGVGVADKCEGPQSGATQLKLGDEADGGSVLTPQGQAGLSDLDDERGP